MVVLLPVGVQPFIKGDEFLEERIALTVGAGGVLQGERAQLQVQLTHLLDDAKILHIEGLDLIGQLVMVGTLARLELIDRVVLVDLKVAVDHNLVHLRLHRLDLLMSDLVEAERQALLQLVLDELGTSFRINHEVAVHDLVARKLEQQECALSVISLLSVLGKPCLHLLCKLLVHSLFTFYNLLFTFVNQTRFLPSGWRSLLMAASVCPVVTKSS